MKFYLLDVSYEVEGNKPVIIMWGVDEHGDRIVIKDEKFRPYFYVLPKVESDLEKIKNKIMMLSSPKSPIIGIDVVERRLVGRKRKMIKVTTILPEYVRKYREEVKRMDEVEDVLEADIRFSMRYIIDHELRPCGWHDVEIEKEVEDKRYRVKKVYLAKNPPRPIAEDKKPVLKTVAFDIEVYNKRGTPLPERDPIIAIAIADENGVESKIAESLQDTPLLFWFKKRILDKDPDIIVGYNINKFDWPYILERAKRNGIVMDVGRRVGAQPTTSAYGHVSVQGRLNVDLYDFAEEIHEVKVKTLENVAKWLGIIKGDEKPMIAKLEIYKYWEEKEKRSELKKYVESDADVAYKMSDKFIPFGEQLSYLTGLPLDQVMAASVGFRVEWYLMRIAYKVGEVAPNRVERRAESYRGAIVLKPKKGVHRNVAVIDFSSMYPNIIIKYNVGPDTLVRPGEEVDPGECYVSPIGYMFRKKPDAFFKFSLQTLLKMRKEIKEKMKGLDPESEEYKLLDERQKAVKVLANAHYGYMGWVHARWYCRECAEAVTAWGRELILKAIKRARELGLEVIYGDTDSLFVKYDKEKVEKLIEWIEKELGFEVKIDKIYEKVFFTEAKKRYAGILKDGRIDIVGFEAVRGDWAEISKEVQSKVIELILKEGDIKGAVEYVRNVVKELKEGKVPLEKLIIWKTLEKEINEYKAELPHVVAARRALAKGYKIRKGEKIGYVIVKGGGRLSSRAWPWFMVKREDVDVNYYIEHQVIPSALRVLGYFGVTEATLRGGSEGLLRFFRKSSTDG